MKQGGDTADFVRHAAEVVCVQTTSLPFGSLPLYILTEEFGIFLMENGNFFEKI